VWEGTHRGDYEIGRLLGRGGMGDVYEANHAASQHGPIDRLVHDAVGRGGGRRRTKTTTWQSTQQRSRTDSCGRHADPDNSPRELRPSEVVCAWLLGLGSVPGQVFKRTATARPPGRGQTSGCVSRCPLRRRRCCPAYRSRSRSGSAAGQPGGRWTRSVRVSCRSDAR